MSRIACVMLMIFVTVGAASAAEAGPPARRSIAVDSSACGAIPAPLENAAKGIVGSNWLHYKPFMCLYPVKGPSGKAALFILALDVARATDANSYAFVQGKPEGPDDMAQDVDPIPLPTIINAAGTVVGKLSVDFPNNPPGSSVASFSDWKDDFPHRIRQRVNDPTQNYSRHTIYCLPALVWNRRSNSFVKSSSNRVASCSGIE